MVIKFSLNQGLIQTIWGGWQCEKWVWNQNKFCLIDRGDITQMIHQLERQARK